MLYAVTGVKLQNRLQTRSDLLATLQNNPDAIRLLRPSRNEIEALAVDSTGRLLASGDSAGVVRFENISRWVSDGAAVHLGGVILQQGIAFSPHGGALGVLTEQSSPHTPAGPVESGRTNLYVIDTATRKSHLLGSWQGATTVVPYPGPSFAYSPDGREIALAIASAGTGGSIRGDTLRLLDASTGRLVWQRSYPIEPGQLNVSLRFAPDGTLIGSGQQGETLLWNVHTGRVVRRFPIGGEPAASADGHTLALAVNSGPNITAAISKIAVIDLRTGRYRFLPAELSSTLVKTLAVTPNGRSVVGATIHGDTSVWNTGSGVISQTIAAPVGAIGIAALDPAGRTLLIGSRDGSVTAFDLSGSRRLGRAFQWNTPNQSCITSPCFAVDRLGDVMAVTQGDGSVATIDLHTLRRTATLPARNGPLATAIAFFPDGRTLLTGGSAGRITLWDVRSHRVLRTIGVGAPVMGGTVSPDGRLIAVQTQAPGSTGSLVEVRPAAGGRPIWSARVQDGASGVNFSPNGRAVAALGCCTSLSTVISWDARSGRQLFDRRLSDHATAIAYASDSRTLAVGTENGEALLWSARRGTQAAPPLHAASASVAAMSFSPDSKLLAVSSTDESTTLWNTQSRAQLGGSFPSRPGVITVPVFEPNGRLLIEYLADAAQWPLDVGAWERFACQVAGRNLTQTEWRAILPNRPYMRVCPR
ncbi:MAG: WD40 repeat domain-containing protein [Solirubrobacterales bacterium]|nr:WD40 repeat domain-containing protein [Solirubrobacterales bacterium]